MGVIEAALLTKRYPRVVALDGLDLSIGEGSPASWEPTAPASRR
jgi:ABC-type multidrug transport system ATPase subunit